MYKRISGMLSVIIICSLILSGCADASEVDDNIYVVAIGLDKGVHNKVIVTIQYPTYKSGKGGGKSSSGGLVDSSINSIEAPSLLEAIDLMNMSISRRVSLLHTKLLVVSEDFAKDGVGAFLSPLTKFRGARITMSVVVTRGKAMDFIKENKTSIGESITKSIELMVSQSKNTGFFPIINLNEFYRDVTSKYGNASAIYAGINKLNELSAEGAMDKPPLRTQKSFKPGELPRTGLVKREFVGTALFNGDKMVGSFDPYETRYMLMIKNKFNSGIMTIEDKMSPGNGVILSLRRGRNTKVKGYFKNGVPVIDIKLNIEADISAIHSRINYESLKLVEKLNSQLEEEIKKGAEKTIRKAQKEYKTDVFGFGKKFAGYFPTIEDWEKYNWLSHYPDAEVNVNVEVNVRRTGLTINSTPIEEGPDSNKQQEE